jgi:hypothetical protein
MEKLLVALRASSVVENLVDNSENPAVDLMEILKGI